MFYADGLSEDENPFSLLFHIGNESFGEQRKQIALSQIDQLNDVLGSLFHQLTLEEHTAPRLSEMRQRLQNFDIAGFYDTMPDRDAEKRALWRGGVLDEQYLISLEDVATTYPWDQRPAKLGDLFLDLEVSAPLDPDGPQYGIEGRSQVLLGGIAPDELAQAMEDFIGRVGQRYDYVAEAGSMEEIRKRFLNLRKEDTRLVHVIKEGMPQVYDRIWRYFELRDVLNHVTQEGQPAAMINLDFHFDTAKIKVDYPALGNYLEDLTVLGSLDAILRDLDGNRLARMQFDAGELRGTAQCVLRDGALVPCDEQWVAVGKDPIRFTSLRSFSGVWEVDALVNFSGLVFEIGDIQLYTRYRRRKGKISVDTLFQEKPKIAEVSGAAYGFVPSWLIDVVIPGNLQEMIDGFINAAAEGKDGDGTQVQVSFAPIDGDQNEVGVHFATAILHSGFLATVSEIFGDMVVPTDEERASLWSFASDAFDAFSDDYQSFRQQYP